MSEPFAEPLDGMHSRDLSSGDTDGPQLTQFETASARDAGPVEQPAAAGGMAEARRERPQFSPVAQPGMIEAIHWHTVESREGARARQQAEPPRRRGRRGRRGRGRETIIIPGRRGRGQARGGGGGPPHGQ